MGGALTLLERNARPRVRCGQHLVRLPAARGGGSREDLAFRFRGIGRLRDDFFTIEGVDAIERKLRDAGATGTSFIATTRSTASTTRASPAKAASDTIIASTPKRPGAARIEFFDRTPANIRAATIDGEAPYER